jgi:hypothetical protein
MTHLTEEQLVLAFYGEHGRDHLARCEACRAAYERLEAVLAHADALDVPERGPEYGREVWARIAPRLDEPRPRSAWWQALFVPRRWAVAGAMAAVIVGAFFAGRFWPYHAPAPARQQPLAAETRERILVVSLGEHLDRSQMVLLELVNAQSGGEMDMSAKQQRADDLVSANRLFRQAAAYSGDFGTAEVLEDLERVLLEIARGPSRLSSQQFEHLRGRIEAQGIMFKVRVIDSKLRTRSSAL